MRATDVGVLKSQFILFIILNLNYWIKLNTTTAIQLRIRYITSEDFLNKVALDGVWNGNGDVDTALLSLTNNLDISAGNNVVGKGVEWSSSGITPMGYPVPPSNPYGSPLMQMQQWQHHMYQQPQQPPGYGGYGIPPMRPPNSGIPPSSQGNPFA
ncbi:hypothetical protein PRIPAC_85362 [Pristionchus pacificus]|uniref:Uncharacterized protein n=1 Tax=Pristionchus pacificus TaxID=54126 RepID=A0A2A6BSC4_PRIPA|nr:hypothetical protein PRIPAC_85362 [Pristionchus pacificus]|eukprot:PDM68800.1 hypothetical protein PRIPAC_47102 [Pristionchus pacificus]